MPAKLASALAAFTFLMPAVPQTNAAIVRITFDEMPISDKVIPDSYIAMRGKAFGELDPLDPHNAIVQDIKLAPRNAEGKVEYSATFSLFRPRLATSSHVLLYEIVNRGASLMHHDYSSGDIFLQSGWQGDIPSGGKSANGSDAETILVPVARNQDGSAIIGPVLARFSNMPSGLNTLPMRSAQGFSGSSVPPLPASLDTAAAKLFTHTYEDARGTLGGIHQLSDADWAWADCTKKPFPGEPDPTKVCVRTGFQSELLYQLQYIGKDPPVLGIGLAAIRDLGSFFRHSNKENPVGGQIQHALIAGISQSGNLLRTYLNLGFNQDEAGRQVWDGAMPMIAARQTPLNFRFAVPGGASNLYEAGSDGTVWWMHSSDDARHHPPSGLLDRCKATNSCPKIIEVLGSTEFWSLRASPDFVGTSAVKDIPLPPEVRRYYIASTQHGGGPGGFHSQAKTPPSACVMLPNPNPEAEITRALLERLRQWVVNAKEPPPSQFPTLTAGTLVTPERVAKQMPFIPGIPSAENVANPLIVYDFGPALHANDLSGFITQQPPAILAMLPLLVPSVNADGNEVGGIHTVQQQVPLGTYLGWNVTASGFFKGQYCGLTGSFIPFSITRQQRLAKHDPRRSLEERYHSHQGFVEQVQAATERLRRQGFLLPKDAQIIVEEAQSSDVLVAP